MVSLVVACLPSLANNLAALYALLMFLLVWFAVVPKWAPKNRDFLRFSGCLYDGALLQRCCTVDSPLDCHQRNVQQFVRCLTLPSH